MRTRTRKSVLSILLLAIMLVTVLAVPANASSRKKLIKSIKYYDSKGKLTETITYKRDSKGNITSYTNKWYSNGKVDGTYKYSRKLTYWKGSRYLKKSVSKSSNDTTTLTFTKKGVMKKQVTKYKGGGEYTITYKSSGKRLKSSVHKDGDYTYKSTYDKHGNETSFTEYYKGKKKYSTKYKNTYKKGVLRKCVTTYSDSKDKNTATYDKHGNIIKRVFSGGDYKATYTYKNKYSGGYLKTVTRYYNKQKEGKTVYTYTSKKYRVD